MTTLANRTLFITGASRGIGLAIALRAARDGANVVIAAKSDVPNPKLPGTIHTAAAAVEAAGGKALAIRCDIREEGEVRAAVAAAVGRFGGIDILVNNASAIWLRGVLDTPMKRFDLMQQVNARGTFLCAQACLPHLLQAANPHILTLAPPPSLDPKWWAPHTGYTLAKMGLFTPAGMYCHGLMLFLCSGAMSYMHLGEARCLSLIAIRTRWSRLVSPNAHTCPSSLRQMEATPQKQTAIYVRGQIVSGKRTLAGQRSSLRPTAKGFSRRRAAMNWQVVWRSSFAGA